MPRFHLRQLRNASRPSRAFEQRLRQQLCLRPRFLWSRVAGFSLAGLMLFFGTGVGAYAYASPEVTDAHPLYGLKRSMEHMQAVVQFSGDAQAQYHAQLMERRLQEAEVLMRLQTIQDSHFQLVESELEASLNYVSEVRQVRHQQLLDRLELQRERMEFLKSQMQSRNTLLELRVQESVRE